MEYHHYQQHEENNTTTTNNNNTSVNVGNVESKSSFLCRQSSTRWIPTGEQVRILRDLYYNCGVRSPSAEQIQKISARLRQYGKIEGKNVFYWFQNHKARERQKRRLTVDVPNPTNKNVASGPCPSPGFYGVGPMGSSGCGDSPVLMERSIGEPWMSGGAGGMGFDHPALWVYDHYTAIEQETTAVAANQEIETLPLFPIQENQEDQENGCSYHHHPESASWNPYHDGDHRATSLELSLSSYYYAPPGSA